MTYTNRYLYNQRLNRCCHNKWIIVVTATHEMQHIETGYFVAVGFLKYL